MRKSLGKGLDSLIKANEKTFTKDPAANINSIFISDIAPNRKQPRKNFDKGLLDDLVESIKTNGLIQPIVVRKLENNKYEIIAGERRWRAAQIAGLSKVPVVVTEATDQKAFELALGENIQREDLNPIEEALAIKNLIEVYNFSHDEILKITGKRGSTIANTIRILDLPENVTKLIAENKLSRGHGIALLALPDENEILKITNQIIKKELSVRQVERIARSYKNPNRKSSNVSPDIYLNDLSKILENKLGLKVRINGNSNSGKVEIRYKALDELNKIMNSIK
ncbi:MAG TPA: ParB/RepB/Spo0J family partition protein [Candidatus Dadabacteria bacterium]|nr:ParB/RepB/Spo0J family partition protein [Candidatus Dadabacteria bacterium]